LDAIRVTVTRGGVVEAVHRVHVRGTDGTALGDDLHCFLRSTLKPLQAIPFVEGYDDLTDDEIAIACASHQAEPEQLAAVRTLLERAEATVDDLECGPQQGRPHGPLGHNCSGKHAAMLAACRAHGWPRHPYRDRAHPLQVRVAALVGAADVAVDGCGIPTFAVPLSRAAALFATVPPRIADAMRSRPELVGGAGADDSELMRTLPGWIAKHGAEGLFCVRSSTGDGFSFKVEDGAQRALRPALAQVLGVDALRSVPVCNSLGDVVGSIA
jgi:L-asparaginase II